MADSHPEHLAPHADARGARAPDGAARRAGPDGFAVAGSDLDLPGRHPGFGTGAWIWLLRHGEVAEEWQGRAYGGLDVPLSERGREDTRRAIERFGALPFEAVATSTLARARELGEGIARVSGASLAASAGLAEIQRGRWQGRPIADLTRERPEELASFYADPWNWNAHGGETDRDVLRRAWPELERLLAPRPRLVAVACHYNVVRVLLARMLGVEPARSFRLRVDVSGACLLHDAPAREDEDGRRAPGGFRLLRSNVLSPDPWPPRA